MPSAPHLVRDGVRGHRMIPRGPKRFVANARLFAHGRAKRLAEYGDTPALSSFYISVWHWPRGWARTGTAQALLSHKRVHLQLC